MRLRTVVALLAVVGALGGASVFVALGGGSDGALQERWVSDTTSDVDGNHHAVAAGRVDGREAVYVPVSGRRGAQGCALVALDGSGEERWRHEVPPRNCTIHAVADPALADADRDGTLEVVASTTEREVVARHPLTGDAGLRHDLTDYGYTRPVVADATGDGRPELVVTDVAGTLFVVGPDGEAVWRRSLDSFSWATPAVADFDADSEPEVVVGLGDGRVVAFDGEGRVEWNRTVDEAVTWMTSGQVDDDPAREVVAATSGGDVVAFDGRGDREWTASLGRFAAVKAVGDGDADGVVEVYATARDGKLRALDGPTGRVEWTTTLTTGDVQMTPPPAMDDLDGDGRPELLAATNDGLVFVLDPADGSVLATYERDAPVWTHATLADTTGDGTDEIYVMYGDGRVVSLAYEA